MPRGKTEGHKMVVLMDEEMLERTDKIVKKFGLGSRASAIRQSVSRWFFEIEKAEQKSTNGHRDRR